MSSRKISNFVSGYSKISPPKNKKGTQSRVKPSIFAINIEDSAGRKCQIIGSGVDIGNFSNHVLNNIVKDALKNNFVYERPPNAGLETIDRGTSKGIMADMLGENPLLLAETQMDATYVAYPIFVPGSCAYAVPADVGGVTVGILAGAVAPCVVFQDIIIDDNFLPDGRFDIGLTARDCAGVWVCEVKPGSDTVMDEYYVGRAEILSPPEALDWVDRYLKLSKGEMEDYQDYSDLEYEDEVSLASGASTPGGYQFNARSEEAESSQHGEGSSGYCFDVPEVERKQLVLDFLDNSCEIEDICDEIDN